MGQVEHAAYFGEINTYFREQVVDRKKILILLHRERRCGLDSTDSG
jgi:hypothetical protein